MKNRSHYSDDLERQIADALRIAGIDFVHENEDKAKTCGLDFYLPGYDVYIEIKRFHADRIDTQMKQAQNVIAIQGVASAKFIIELLKKQQP